MTALIMALAAGMVVGSDESGWASTEIEERLCIQNREEGTWQYYSHCYQEMLFFKVTLKQGYIWLTPKGEKNPTARYGCQWVDEGGGKCRMILDDPAVPCWLGIYKREAGRLIICLGDPRGERRPIAFWANYEQSLFIFHNVQPPPKVTTPAVQRSARPH
jgi:hypothetical protein